MPEQERKSLFQTGYIKQPDTSIYEAAGKDSAYLKLTNQEQHFWELLITKLTETHAEKYTLVQTLSGANPIYSLGSEPVHIEINGYLASGNDIDYRIRFLKKYMMEFRSKHLRLQDRMLEVHVRRTHFLLEIESINMVETVGSPDFTSIGITGVAYKYNIEEGAPLAYVYADGQQAQAQPAKTKDPDVKLVSTPTDPPKAAK